MSGPPEDAPLDRAAFLKRAIGGLGDSLLASWDAYRDAAHPPKPHPPARDRLRPPGAKEESTFRSRCTRCGDCAEACPFGVLAPDDRGWPTLPDPKRRPCAMCPDMPCIAACGTGALEWHPRENRRVGLVEVVAELCVVSQGKECAACAAVCREARAIRPGPDALPWVDTVACTGCGSCLGACPSEGALVLRPRQG